jgi:hypothetical protein
MKRRTLKRLGVVVAGLAALWIGAGAPVDLNNLLKL